MNADCNLCMWSHDGECRNKKSINYKRQINDVINESTGVCKTLNFSSKKFSKAVKERGV